jgi:hypothetical protein
MEAATIGAYLKAGTSVGTMKKLYGLYNIPDLGGTPAKISVTNFQDTTERSISGVQQLPDLNFQFYYKAGNETPAGYTASEWDFNPLQTLKTAERSKAELHFEAGCADGEIAVSWSGVPTVWVTSQAVNGAVSFTLSVSVSSSLDTEITKPNAD